MFDLQGGIDGSGSPVPLTAYVLISLLEAGEVTSSRAVMEAAFCLDADTSKDPYTLALKAYSLSLSDSPKAEQAVQNLINVAEETTNSMHWELPAGSGMIVYDLCICNLILNSSKSGRMW